MNLRPIVDRPNTVLLLCLAISAGLVPSVGAQSGMLKKSAMPVDGNGNGFFEVDELVEYTLVLTNEGATDLTGVNIRDASSGCMDLDTGSVSLSPASAGTVAGAVDVQLTQPLAPGEAVTVTFSGFARATGTCCNQATWTSEDGASGVSDRDPADFVRDEATCVFVSASPGPEYDAIVDKQVLAAGCVAAGSTVEFRIRVHNTGQRPLRNVRLFEALHPALTNVVVDPGLTYDPATHSISVDGGTWGVGLESLYTYRADVPCSERGFATSTAVLTFEDNDGNVYRRTDTETLTWGHADLSSSTKTWQDDPNDGDVIASFGETITFTITIDNTGGCEAVDVTVVDVLDQRFISTAPTLSIGDGGTYDPASREIRWDSSTTPRLAALPAGASVALTFSTQVDPTVAGTSVIPNAAELTVAGRTAACPGNPVRTWAVTLVNGVVHEAVVVGTRLLRNDFVSCLADAMRTLRGGYPNAGLPPVLTQRVEPQECSDPPAINVSHPQTVVITNPVVPYRFPADAAQSTSICPQRAAGSGRTLIFYELADDCTTSLRVRKDPANPTDVLVSW